MGVILDTDHCIEVLRGRVDFSNWLQTEPILYITMPSVAELWFGGYNSKTPERHLPAIERLLDQLIVLPFDHAAAREAGRLKALLKRSGAFIGDLDLQIAGIALTQNLNLATHNTRHFDRIPGLQLLDWLS